MLAIVGTDAKTRSLLKTVAEDPPRAYFAGKALEPRTCPLSSVLPPETQSMCYGHCSLWQFETCKGRRRGRFAKVASSPACRQGGIGLLRPAVWHVRIAASFCSLPLSLARCLLRVGHGTLPAINASLCDKQEESCFADTSRSYRFLCLSLSPAAV